MSSLFVVFLCLLVGSALGCGPGKNNRKLNIQIYPFEEMPLDFVINKGGSGGGAKSIEEVKENVAKILVPYIIEALKNQTKVPRDAKIIIEKVGNVMNCAAIKEVSQAVSFVSMVKDDSEFFCLKKTRRSDRIIGHCSDANNCSPDPNVYLTIPPENASLQVVAQINDTNLTPWGELIKNVKFQAFEYRLQELVRQKLGMSNLFVKIRNDE